MSNTNPVNANEIIPTKSLFIYDKNTPTKHATLVSTGTATANKLS